MEWIQEQWAWLGMAILAFIKLVQDHLMIKQHSERIKDLEDKQDAHSVMFARLDANIEHIKSTTDAIAQQQGINTGDIKDILKRKEERE